MTPSHSNNNSPLSPREKEMAKQQALVLKKQSADSQRTDNEKAVSQAQQEKNLQKKKAAKKEAVEKGLKTKQLNKKNSEKKKQKQEWLEEVAAITNENIKALMRPRIYNDGTESNEALEHTYESAKLDLLKRGVSTIRTKLCAISSFNKVIVFPDDKEDLQSNTWRVPYWSIDGKEKIFYIPPTENLYSESDFSLNSDSDWEYTLRSSLEVSNQYNFPIDELANLIGLPTTDEAIDMKSPHVSLSTLYDSIISSELENQLQQLGLFDLDKHYIELGLQYLYPPNGVIESGAHAVALANENNTTRKVCDTDPRDIWFSMDEDEVFELRNKVTNLYTDATQNLSSISASLDKALSQLENLISLREQIQESILTAFKAGQEYTTNYRIANDLKTSQKATSMAEGGNKKGVQTKTHTEKFIEAIKAFEATSGEQKTTVKKVISFISNSDKSEWKNTLESKGARSLKGVIYRNRTKK